MCRIIWLLALIGTFLSAYSDMDMGGVSDALDNCPNTLMMELVDQHGCPIEKLSNSKNNHFEASLGIGYEKIDSDAADKSSAFSIRYFSQQWSLNLYTVTYLENSSNYAKDDLYLSAYYSQPLTEKLMISLGTGLVLPLSSDNGNEKDYFVSAYMLYHHETLMLYAYYKYSFVNDLYASDTQSKMIGIAHTVTPKLYSALSFSRETSMYDSSEDIDYINYDAKYTFENQWFMTIRLSKGMSKLANELSTLVSIGYIY